MSGDTPNRSMAQTKIGRVSLLVGVGLSIAILAFPIGVGAPTTIHYYPPFHFRLYAASAYDSYSGCGHAGYSPLKFNRTSATLTWQATVTARYCHVGTYVGGGPGASMIVWIPLKTFPGTSTSTRVLVTWNVSASGAISHHLSSCPNVTLDRYGDGSSVCEDVAYVDLETGARLYDLTNGSTFYPLNSRPHAFPLYYYGFNMTDCQRFRCTSSNGSYTNGGLRFNNTTSEVWRFHVSLNHGHRYLMGVFVYVATSVTIVGYRSGAHAAASIDLRTAGRGAQLVGITER